MGHSVLLGTVPVLYWKEDEEDSKPICKAISARTIM